MCGEKRICFCVNLLLLGSPPRVRGEAISSDLITPSVGITPACAGRSFRHELQKVKWEDHPRVCGEKHFDNAKKAGMEGSPPRVRGEARPRGSFSRRPRITPACAGRSISITPKRREWKDHPRVCGEKRVHAVVFPVDRGSPPRVRGEAGQTPREAVLCRITPACAGRRSLKKAYAIYEGDHPRVCGEKFKVNVKNRSKSGSPPRVRGEGILWV